MTKADEHHYYPIFASIASDTVSHERELAEAGETWRVYYFCTVCGSYTYATSGSERRLTQMCPACLDACHIRFTVNTRLAEKMSHEEWHEMMRNVEATVSEAVHIVRKAVAKSRYERLYGDKRRRAK